ncbi:MAG: indolepyruvate ferredoxin oxidoreductase family protein [Caulobacteraceae bacterium]|nr:indolepyruvate ferredoxin oxidoreductase family protein [Caulobacteraceae bacterium]
MSDVLERGPGLSDYRLEDRYTLKSGRVFLNGSQALVRLPIMQRQRDMAAGLNTAGFISGYTGSPLGGYDTALHQAEKILREHQVHFQPGVNEDLAATAVWGSQQTHLVAGAKFDGVFGLWYGKGPGVDRSGDALKHGSYAGASQHGGVLVLAGDDHGAKSSTTAHQSDHAFVHFGMPYLNPANVQDYLDLGLHGFAMSRFSGCWIGMKCVTDTVESTASVYVDPHRVEIVLPSDVERPQTGLNLRWGVPALEAEARQYQMRLPAVNAYVRANRLDREVISSARGVLGIVTSGKAFLDVMQALDALGLDTAECERLGLSVYKVAMPWPLEPVGAAEFAAKNRELLVVEEKRPIIEDQLARMLVNNPNRPVLVGKQDQAGQPLISAEGELAPGKVALVLGQRLFDLTGDARLGSRLESLRIKAQGKPNAPVLLKRMPSFCAGCPHNTSTKVPDGSIAFGGIGCHGMATFLPERHTPTLFQMGGEGAPWIGIAPFSKTEHIFQNLGDGTYFHSGLLAIRAAVAAKVNMTYKILVNDAIAMTGGQKIEGQVRVDELVRQVKAEGVGQIVVVSNDIEKYKHAGDFPAGVAFHHRDDLEIVQMRLRDVPGVTAIIYEQYCATELRRRRKRGTAVDPDQRTFINERVCEGCGDCSVQSNCIAIEPVETEFGRKRRINQSACNKDFSCLKGYCPSFVSLYGAKPRKRGGARDVGFDVRERAAALPQPRVQVGEQPYNILVSGVGGAGVVTLGALIGTAAHLEGKGCSVLDMSGLAQRNGPVTSHIRIAATPEQLHANRITAADLVIGSDIVVTSSPDVTAKIIPDRTRAVVNSHVAPTSDFASNPDLDLSAEGMRTLIGGASDQIHFVEATELANGLMGNELAANLFLIGYAIQSGWMPVSLGAMEAAIELNKTSVDMNKDSLAWGRLAAADLEAVRGHAGLKGKAAAPAAPESLDAVAARNRGELVAYQNTAYADRYSKIVRTVRERERAATGGEGALSMAVARYLYKLMAYKDEYEVARLYSLPSFVERLRDEFEGDFRIELNMAPPILQRRDPTTGRYRKRAFGPWILPVLGLLQRFKTLRGTPLDIFGYAAHRKAERALIAEYEAVIDEVLQALTPDNHSLAVRIASLPEQIRGYDVVKDASLAKVRAQLAELLARFRAGLAPQTEPKLVIKRVKVGS